MKFACCWEKMEPENLRTFGSLSFGPRRKPLFSERPSDKRMTKKTMRPCFSYPEKVSWRKSATPNEGIPIEGRRGKSPTLKSKGADYFSKIHFAHSGHGLFFGKYSGLYFLFGKEEMSRKKGYEIRISVGQDDLDKLQGGEILQIGEISFGLTMKVSLQKRKTTKVVQATS
jgi:hypothetical protein